MSSCAELSAVVLINNEQQQQKEMNEKLKDVCEKI
jgi:hypothetical protein